CHQKLLKKADAKGGKAAPAKKKEASSGGSGKAKKKKWSKGKVRDKLQNMVLFDQATYDKLHKEIVSVKLITPSVVSERLKVRASLARAGLRELHDKGLIKVVVKHGAQLVYRKSDKFPSKLDIPKEKLKEYDTGAELLLPEKAKTIIAQKRLIKKKNRFFERVEMVARAELLDTQQEGFIEPDEGIPTCLTNQTQICDAVDIASATKHFSLDLRFGPYSIDYTLNGRFMLLGGRKGHIAAFDWMTKDLMTEINVMETVRDIQWLHTETMFAVGQKRWLRIYDKNGTELHCIKSMFDIKKLQFLPRHFLLVGSSGNSFITWLDVSVGKQIASFPTKCGVLDVLTQNQSNAIIVGGNSRGVVTMWSPNNSKPLIEMFAHKGPILGIDIDQTGNYMATSGLDNKLRIWDLRNNFNEIAVYSSPLLNYTHLTFSQRNFLAVNYGEHLQVYFWVFDHF
ncbi:hypothetical protein Mgra_00009658, partial [Meloidogyne graminicola]